MEDRLVVTRNNRINVVTVDDLVDVAATIEQWEEEFGWAVTSIQIRWIITDRFLPKSHYEIRITENEIDWRPVAPNGARRG